MFRNSKPDMNPDGAVKASLILRLKECVSEIVMKFAAESWMPLKNDEATNTLCCILEAVFIHGLKNTFIKSLFSSRRENSIPNPSFWEFVMIFSHRDVIEQIRRLNYINNDVGKSRAWIRITLNEMSLVSYLENMFRNPSYVRSFYKPSAFLRDAEKCDILKNYLVGVVESCKFDLVVDNSLLNQWTSGPLSLVGLWMDDNISQGIDVAQNMDLQTIPQLGKTKNPVPEFMTVLRRQPLLAEEDALRIIMASKPSSNNTASGASSRRNSGSSQTGIIYGREPMVGVASESSMPSFGSRKVIESVVSKHDKHDSTMSKSKDLEPVDIKNKSQSLPITQNFKTKSPTNESYENELGSEVVEPDLKFSSTDARNIDEEELSYMDLLAAYNKEKKVGVEIYSGSPTPFDKFMKTATDNEGDFLPNTTSSGDVDSLTLKKDGFEIINSFNSSQHKSDMYSQITEFVGRISNEVGMDVQQYTCKFCRAPIGMSFASARVCHFTGNYFCSTCHVLDVNVIPSRILLNWDFTLYSVCRLSNIFLEEVKDLPVFDLEHINRKLYSFIDELAELRDLRTRLNYVSIYLKTCKDETVFDDFKKEISPREHLFEKIHLYSLSDLLSVTTRTLTTPMNKLLIFGKSHIISCKICKAKGFVCEICKNPEVIFPFNLESIFKCRSCGAVYHKECMNHSKPCPRCQRWKNIPQGEDICDDD